LAGNESMQSINCSSLHNRPSGFIYGFTSSSLVYRTCGTGLGENAKALLLNLAMGRETKKQISEVEEKPFTSSVHICPEAAVERGRGRLSKDLPPFTITLFPSR
jgi:hypothetical protein